MWLIALKEIKNLFYSPRFVLLASASFILVFSSIFAGYFSYIDEQRLVAIGENLALERQQNSRDLASHGFTAIRHPEKLSIFDQGVTSVLGRKGRLRSGISNAMSESPHSNDPALALFGQLDLTFIVTEILALFALLFTYDAVNGEKERGTFRALLANPISRASIASGKFMGTSIPTIMILLLPFLTSLALLLTFTDLSFSGGEWMRLITMLAAHIVYLVLFCLIGLTMSALTKRRFSSLLLSLFAWIVITIILPSLVIQVSTQIEPPMNKDEYTKTFRTIMEDDNYRLDYRTRDYLAENPTTGKEWQENKVFDRIEKMVEDDRKTELDALRNKLNNRNRITQNLANGLALISPGASLKTAQHALANTGPGMMQNLDESRQRYEKVFSEFAWNMKLNAKEEQQRRSRVNFKVDDQGIYRATVNDKFIVPKLDLSGLPRFNYRSPSAAEAFSNALPGISALVTYCLIFAIVLFVAITKYDVR